MTFRFSHSDELSGIIEIEADKFNDSRGFFAESFRADDFLSEGIPEIKQENRSFSHAGVFRGLHYQLNPMAQGKIVYCLSGEIYDYVVDIRKGSPTYAQWKMFKLSSGDKDIMRMIYVPPGFAHGFYVPGEPSHVVYKVTECYSKKHEMSIRWSDPEIGIEINEEILSISDKDTSAPLLKNAINNFIFK